MNEPRESPSVRDIVVSHELDADLGALLWLLAEKGVPLVVASLDGAAAERLRSALSRAVRTGQPSRDTLAGGVVVAGSFEYVLRLMGTGASGEVGDAARDLGVVVVHDGQRVRGAHYVRPVERDGAGHLQRRPPALLSAWNSQIEALDHFYWSITDELATRVGMTRVALEDEHARRIEALGGRVVGSRPWH